MVGYSFAFTADFNKAMVAASRVFKLIDRKPQIDTNPTAGLKLDQIHGNVKIEDAEFTYPTRKDAQILNKFNMSIAAGENIALVGESGCGKSTVIQIIQRFFDLNHGSLEMEGHNIEALNLPYVRSQLGVVSQEPSLFNRSIREASKKKYGIIWEFFPNGGPPPFGNPSSKKKNYGLFCILGPKKHFWFSQKFSLFVSILTYTFGNMGHPPPFKEKIPK